MAKISAKKEPLERKARWVKDETLKIHKIAPQTRIASSLSPIEIFVALYYGGILKVNAKNPHWQQRDRFIVSKGHGAVSMYPILADLGFFSKEKLKEVCKDGSQFGSIPDSAIPGFETVNGSLGHGLGVGCGIALGLMRNKINSRVFVLLGDGELYEGSVWEAVMFAGHHHLGNLIAIVDDNKISMLNFCKNIINLKPLKDKFSAFGWKTKNVDGHDLRALVNALTSLKKDKSNAPKVLIANTKKGKGVTCLENDPLCHIRSLTAVEIDEILESSCGKYP